MKKIKLRIPLLEMAKQIQVMENREAMGQRRRGEQTPF
jgi:hypothetical protein